MINLDFYRVHVNYLEHSPLKNKQMSERLPRI